VEIYQKFNSKIIQKLMVVLKIKQNLWAVRLKAYRGGGALRAEIYQKLSSKINQKFIGVHRAAHLFLECPSGRNLTESIQNQTESWGSTPKGILMRAAPFGRKLIKN